MINDNWTRRLMLAGLGIALLVSGTFAVLKVSEWKNEPASLESLVDESKDE